MVNADGIIGRRRIVRAFAASTLTACPDRNETVDRDRRLFGEIQFIHLLLEIGVDIRLEFRARRFERRPIADVVDGLSFYGLRSIFDRLRLLLRLHRLIIRVLTERTALEVEKFRKVCALLVATRPPLVGVVEDRRARMEAAFV